MATKFLLIYNHFLIKLLTTDYNRLILFSTSKTVENAKNRRVVFLIIAQRTYVSEI